MSGKAGGNDKGARRGTRPPPAKHFNPSPRGGAPVRGGVQTRGGAPARGGAPTHEELFEAGIGAEDDSDGVIEGRNTVIEAIRANIAIDKVYIINEESDATLRYIASSARAAGATVVQTDRRKLDSMSVTHAHQGVIAQASCTVYATVGDILEISRQRGEDPLIVLCDEISDPHNLGAIIRTCEASGAHGVIVPKRRSAGLTATVAKASSGAVYHMAVARVTNLTAAIEELKKEGVWVFGADASGDTSLWRSDFRCPAAIVIGSEGAGISRLVREKCDFNICIPMFGKLSSLNASVSAAVLLYEAVRQRRAF